MSLLISESYINASEHYSFGDSEPYEPYTDNIGKLFRDMQREYGRCLSKVYVDTDTGVQAVGWVFSKRMAYEDAPDQFYTREVWVTLHDAPPTKSTEYHYHELAS